MASRNFRETLAQSLGLSSTASRGEIMQSLDRMLGEDDGSGYSLREGDDPRDQMHALTEVEMDKARAAGQTLSYVEALGRARKAHPKLDRELSEGYQSGRWTR